jgi:glycosyltransferase involved in cell wall biosynthesis
MEVNHPPLLTVITAVWNNKTYMAKAIENFLSQQCAEAEMVIIDGASTDGTAEIIQSYANKYPLIRFVSEPDSGQSDAMNKGIAMARAPYISFLNVDDFYEEGALNAVCHTILTYVSPDFIVGNCNVWNNQGELIYVNKPKRLKSWHLLSGETLPVNPSAYFYKKSIHQYCGLYSPNNHYCMDLEFLVKASRECSMLYIDQVWGNFRMLEGTKTFSDQKAGNLEQRKQELFNDLMKSGGGYSEKFWVGYWKARRKFIRQWRKCSKSLLYYPKALWWKLTHS